LVKKLFARNLFPILLFSLYDILFLCHFLSKFVYKTYLFNRTRCVGGKKYNICLSPKLKYNLYFRSSLSRRQTYKNEIVFEKGPTFCTKFDPLNDFSIRRSSYHLKAEKCKNLRAFDFLNY